MDAGGLISDVFCSAVNGFCTVDFRVSVVLRYQKRSRVAKGGGSSPFFREEEIVLWIDKDNWTNDLHLQ